MAAIYLIRHGQASFGQADYDQLSAMGIKQSKILGQSWPSKSMPCKTYSGDLLRHGQTLEYFMESFEKKRVPVVLHSGFNEFDHVDILTRYNANWHNLAAMAAEINPLKQPNNSLQKQLALALTRWISGDFDNEYKESWPQFKTRCVRALQDIIEQERANSRQADPTSSKDILVFTSGGTISVIIQHILQLNDQQTLNIIRQIRNASVSKLLFSDDNLSLDYFNNYSHLTLPDADLVTFR